MPAAEAELDRLGALDDGAFRAEMLGMNTGRLQFVRVTRDGAVAIVPPDDDLRRVPASHHGATGFDRAAWRWMHGAIGHADKCDIGLFTRKAMAVANDYGSALAHRARFARLANDHAG